MNTSSVDPTRIDIATDPIAKRLRGVARHGNVPFDVPYISLVAENLWQGGCETGLVLPTRIDHVVSLYPWERYTVEHELKSELYVRMYDSTDQGFAQVDSLAQWINICRGSGPVLVSCQAGLNRSSLVAARALYLDGFGTGDDVIAELRSKRSPAVLCNRSFENEVRSWW